ncbi:MAG: hypothetical protein QW500_02725 [Candidatus Micrarchaeia archaeon]
MLDLRGCKVTHFSINAKRRMLFGKWKEIDPNRSVFYKEYVKIHNFLKEASEKDLEERVDSTIALIIGLSLKGFNVIQNENRITLTGLERNEMLELVIFISRVS